MSGSNPVDAIFIHEVKPDLSKEKTLEENLEIAMKKANGHWLIGQYGDEQKELMAAVLVVSDFYGIDSPEFARIQQEMKFVNALFRTPSNVPVDWNQLLDTMDKDLKPIGIPKIWKKIKGGGD